MIYDTIYQTIYYDIRWDMIQCIIRYTNEMGYDIIFETYDIDLIYIMMIRYIIYIYIYILRTI
jgi:hypothetical protein